MFRSLSHASRSLAVAALVAAPAVSMAQADNRPVVVVFTFTNSSIGPAKADFDGIATGVQDLLITDLASNSKVRLVDRAHLAEILGEQKLAKDGAVDPTTAVRVGKILGAQYAITGGFMSDGKGKAVMTSRTIDIETTQIINPQRIDGAPDNVLGMISQLSNKVGGANLAPKPGRKTGDAGDAGATKPADAGAKTAPAAPASTGADLYAKTVAPSVVVKTMSSKLSPADLKTYSSALDEMDKKNNAKAITLLKQVANANPDFEPAQRNLKKLGA